MTTYTANQRAAIARALKAAKPLLWDGTGDAPDSWSNSNQVRSYICDAILSAGRIHAITGEEAWAARELIHERIDRCFSLADWLKTRAGIKASDITPPRLQAYRHAWLDQLIAEFSMPAAHHDGSVATAQRQ